MKTRLKTFAIAALGLFAATAFGDTVLTQDEDWTGQEATKLMGTIDLNGHNLTISQFAGDCTITESNSFESYELLDYIESTGGQYIDTGYTHAGSAKVECVVEVAATQPEKYAAIFGARLGTYKACAYVFYARHYAESVSAFNRSYSEQTGDSFPRNVKTTLTCQDNDAAWLTADGATGSITAVGIIANGANPMFIFAQNTSGTGGGKQPTSSCNMKLYSFKILESTVVKRDLVPARRVRDGKVGLLDLVNPGPDEFHVNQGTGADFTAGAVIGEKRGHLGELHVNVAAGTVTGNAKLTGSATLVKDGEGTLIWDGVENSVADSCPILVSNGVFRLGMNVDNVFGSSGKITVKGKGQFDLNTGSDSALALLTRTFDIEGDGPDGSGAIVNSAPNDKGGCYLATVVLTGDATIGGTAPIYFHPNYGTSAYGVTGPDYVLTVKNTYYVSFGQGSAYLDVKRVVCDGGVIRPCSNTRGLFNQITEGVFLKNGGILAPWSGVVDYELPFAVTVEAGETGSIQCDGKETFSAKFTGAVTVGNEAALTIAPNSRPCTFAGEIDDNGTISSTATATITGTLRGTGAITGAGVTFGEGSCWHIDIKDPTVRDPIVRKVDFSNAAPNVLVNLGMIDVSSDNAAGYYRLAPVGELTAEQVEQIALRITDVNTGDELKGLLLIMNGRLGVRIPSGMTILIR